MISIGSSGSYPCTGCALMTPIISHRPSLSRQDPPQPRAARAPRRLKATARQYPPNGDIGGAYAAAQDAYRMASEALLAPQQLKATGEDGRA